MRNKILSILGMAALATMARAQYVSGSTTLSTNMAGSNNSTSGQFNIACLASGTNVNTPSLSSGTPPSILLVGKEGMNVLATAPGTACYVVQRGAYANKNGGGAAAHTSGEKVWVLQPTNVTSGDPSRPQTVTQWFGVGDRYYQPLIDATTPAIPSAIATNATTDVAGKTWFSAINVKQNTIATGACLLQGATVTTDTKIFALWDDHGNLMANTALAGTADANASKLQCIAFTQPIGLNDGQYFVGIQTTGTTDTFQTYAANSLPTSWPTGVITGGTYGTLVNLTLTSTFTANQGPIMTLY